MKRITLSILITSLATSTLAVCPAQDRSRVLVPLFQGVDEPTMLVVLDGDTTEPLDVFDPFLATETRQIQVAKGDVSGDGIDDIIVGAGPGGGPHVRVFDGVNGAAIGEVARVGDTGLNVAAGDLNEDGFDDVIVGAGPGGGPRVRVFSGADFGGSVPPSAFIDFEAVPTQFTGGVRVAAGDINNDGVDDIIVGSGAGDPAEVRVYDGSTQLQVGEFVPYSPMFTGGVFVAAGDVNSDGLADIVVGAGPGDPAGPHVRVFDGLSSLGASAGDPPEELFFFRPYGDQFSGGVYVSAGDITGDGRDDIVTAASAGAGPRVIAITPNTGAQVLDIDLPGGPSEEVPTVALANTTLIRCGDFETR